MLMVGLAINNITPSARVGGKPVRAYMLRKYTKAPMENAFATVIADRGLDTFPFVVLAILTIIFTVSFLSLPEWIVIALIVSLVVLIVVFIIILYMSINEAAGQRITLWLVGLVKRFSKSKHFEIGRKALEAMNGFQSSMCIMIRDRRVLMYGLPLSFDMVHGNNQSLYCFRIIRDSGIPRGDCSSICNSYIDRIDSSSSGRCWGC